MSTSLSCSCTWFFLSYLFPYHCRYGEGISLGSHHIKHEYLVTSAEDIKCLMHFE